MSGVILAVPDRPEAAPRVLAAAAWLARLAGSGRINVLVIRLPPLSTILPSEEVLTRQHEARIRDEESRRVNALKRIFDEWSSALAMPGVTTGWADIEGMADQLASEWGRRADFIVLKRPTDHQLDQERRALHAALFDTDRPVLLVPPETQPTPFGERIAIAWRDDERTIKAVLSALRCATEAREIHVLAGVRGTVQSPALPAILQEHGVNATLHVLPIAGQQAFGATLLRAARQLRADLLVMGAFAHHPLRSLILGGVTRHVLAHADLPVLMRH